MTWSGGAPHPFHNYRYQRLRPPGPGPGLERPPTYPVATGQALYSFRWCRRHDARVPPVRHTYRRVAYSPTEAHVAFLQHWTHSLDYLLVEVEVTWRPGPHHLLHAPLTGAAFLALVYAPSQPPVPPPPGHWRNIITTHDGQPPDDNTPT